MDTLSIIVLILVSMYAYSAGAVAARTFYCDPKPRLTDILLLMLIWSGGIWTRLALDWNKWLLTLAWVVLAYVAGWVKWRFGKKEMPRSRSGSVMDIPAEPAKGFKKLWLRWKAFSQKSGGFQTRIILSLFFFLAVAPFGLAVKIFRDPLRLREKNRPTYWVAKKETTDNLEQSRKQF